MQRTATHSDCDKLQSSPHTTGGPIPTTEA